VARLPPVLQQRTDAADLVHGRSAKCAERFCSPFGIMTSASGRSWSFSATVMNVLRE
jgi:hypothetical protein